MGCLIKATYGTRTWKVPFKERAKASQLFSGGQLHFVIAHDVMPATRWERLAGSRIVLLHSIRSITFITFFQSLIGSLLNSS